MIWTGIYDAAGKEIVYLSELNDRVFVIRRFGVF
jgi:hypothetical protein